MNSFFMNARCLVALALVFTLFITQTHAFTEVFAVTKDNDDNSYYVGNQGSDFYIGKRDSLCGFAWKSSAGSTTGDDDNDRNEEILYDVIMGSEANIYAVGSTRGNFEFPAQELPNLDAAILVYSPTDGSVIRQAQYDEPEGFDNVATSLVQKPDGTLLVAALGSVTNLDQTAVFETRLLEVNPSTLAVDVVHSIVVTTTEFISVTGGPKLLDFSHDSATDSIVAVGHILGRGILWRYDLSTKAVTAQAEWGNVFGSFQTSGFTSDGTGSFYVVGSSSTNILGNTDLVGMVSSEHHAYVIRYDALTTSPTAAAWVRQLGSTGSSQSGNDITIDPVSMHLVVIGAFDSSFAVTDSQTSQTFQIEAESDNGLTDIFVWVLNKEFGDFVDVRKSDAASTVSEDRANVVQVLSNQRVDIGGVINDGVDADPLVCDDFAVSPSVAPSQPSPSESIALPSASAPASTSASQLPIASASVSSGASSPSASAVASASVLLPVTSETPSVSPAFGLSFSPQASSSILLSLISATPSTSPSSQVSMSPQVTGNIFVPLISSTPSSTATGPSVSAASSGSVLVPLISATPSRSVGAASSGSVLVPFISATPSRSVGAASSGSVLVPFISATPSRSVDAASSGSVLVPFISATPSRSVGAVSSGSVLVPFISATPSRSVQPISPVAIPASGIEPETSDDDPAPSQLLPGEVMPTALPVISISATPSPLGLSSSSAVQPPATSAELDSEMVDMSVAPSAESPLEPAPSRLPVLSTSGMPSGTAQVVSPIVTVPVETGVENLPSGGVIVSAEPETAETVVEASVLPTVSVSTTVTTAASEEFPSSTAVISGDVFGPVASSMPSLLAEESPISLSASMNAESSAFEMAGSALAEASRGSVVMVSPSVTGASGNRGPESDGDREEVTGEGTPGMEASRRPSQEPRFSQEFMPGRGSGLDASSGPQPSELPFPIEEVDASRGAESGDAEGMGSPGVSMDGGMDASVTPELIMAFSPGVLEASPRQPRNPRLEETEANESLGTSAEASSLDNGDSRNEKPPSDEPTEIEPTTDMARFSGESLLSPPAVDTSLPRPISSSATGPQPSSLVQPEVTPVIPLPLPTLSPSSSFGPSLKVSPTEKPRGSVALPRSPRPGASAELTNGESPEVVEMTISPEEMPERSPRGFDGVFESPSASEPWVTASGGTVEYSDDLLSSAEESDGLDGLDSVDGLATPLVPTNLVSVGTNSASPFVSPTVTVTVLEETMTSSTIPRGSRRPAESISQTSPTSSSSNVIVVVPSATPSMAPETSLISSRTPDSSSTPGVVTGSPSILEISVPVASAPAASVTSAQREPPETLRPSTSVSAVEASRTPVPLFTGSPVLPSTGIPLPSSSVVVIAPTETTTPLSSVNEFSPTRTPTPSASVNDISPARTPTPSASVNEFSPARTPTPSASVNEFSPTRTPTPSSSANEVPSIRTPTPAPSASFDDILPTQTPIPSSSVSETLATGNPTPLPSGTEIVPTETPIPSSSINSIVATITATPTLSMITILPTRTSVPSTGFNPIGPNVSPDAVQASISPSPVSPSRPTDVDDSPDLSSGPPTPVAPSSEVEIPNPVMPSDEEDAGSSPEAQILGTPAGVAVWSPVPSEEYVPLFPCADYGLVHDMRELNHTNNYQRVSMQIQVAGPNVTNTCGLTERVLERFINFSAANTQSNARQWYVTRVEDGPAVYSGQFSLVTIVEPDEFGSVNETSSPSPSATAEAAELYRGSVIFAVVVYMKPASVDLAAGSYMDYVMSQRIVYALQDQGFRDILWTGMLMSPQVLDLRTASIEDSEEKGGNIGGTIGLVCLGVVGVVVIAIFVVKDSSVGGAASAAAANALATGDEMA